MVLYILFFIIIIGLMIIDLQLVNLKKSQNQYALDLQSTKLYPHPKKKLSVPIILAIIIIYFFSAFRFDIGWDYLAYYNTIEYGYITNIVGRGEYATIFLVDLSRKTGITNIYFAINSFITIFFIFKTMKNYSVNYWISIFLFICFPLFYLNSFSVIRFFSALAITFYGFKYIEKKKFFHYLIIVLLASTFHKAALVAIVFYFARFIKLKTSKIVIILLSLPFIGKLINIFIIKYFPVYSAYTLETTVQEGTKAILFLGLIGIIALLLRNNITKNDEIANLYFNCYLIGMFIYLMFYSQGTMGHRISLFGTIYSILLVPKIISLVQNYKNRLYINMVLIITLIVMFFYILYVGAFTYLPYKTIFDIEN